jgi:arginine/lysine/ornithine decarboxylase
MKFTLDFEYSWHTPGHQGGTAFLKSPVGRIFFDYFGENVLRSDLSISVGSLGSLLDHSGPMGAHERYCARVFGAHRSYSVTNGTSMSNRVIFMAAVARDQIALCDRNCHKSIEHSLVMTGGIPQYLVRCAIATASSARFRPERLSKKAIADGIKDNPLVTRGVSTRAVHSIVTNSTYDGLIYDARRVQELLDPSVDRIHFDEAWYAYARFNPIYKGRHAMHGDPADHKGPDHLRHAFDAQAAGRALAGLAAAHPRRPQPDPHSRFNESYMLHASTSPFYPIIVSNDITAAMMDGPGGRRSPANPSPSRRLPPDHGPRASASSREEAVVLQDLEPDFIKGKGGKKVRFEEASPISWRRIRNAGCCTQRRTGTASAISKTATACSTRSRCRSSHPGIADKGGLEKTGIPATLVTGYLHYRGVEVEKTTDFTVLVLFSIGITKGKWGTLLNALLEFKKDYDNNAPLEQVLPGLTNDHGATYGGMGLRDLADQMFEQLKVSKQTQCMAEAFSTLPEPRLSPNNAYQYLVRDEIEHVPLEELANRVLATSVVPYPPGIPMLMPGEDTGPDDGPYLGYLRALQNWDKRFPASATTRTASRTVTARISSSA